MKFILFTFLVIPTVALRAQSITIKPISKLNYCVGDTLFVPYQASGSFNSDNVFTVQLSDSNGSFTHFTNAGQGADLAGTLPCSLTTLGQHFRVRIISSDPYEASQDNGNDIRVSLLPAPSVAIRNASNPVTVRYRGVGMTGDFLTFSDTSSEPPGSSYRWEFTGHPILQDSAGPSITAIYDTDGSQSATLFVTNLNGCVGTYTSNYYVGTCHPIIPATATIVTSTATTEDYHHAYWVKSGGTLITGSSCPVIYAEPGSTINNERDAGECMIFYMRTGSQFIGAPPIYNSVFILSSGVTLNYNKDLHQIDTFFCDNLTFDDSQVNASVPQQKTEPIVIRQVANAFYVESKSTLRIRILNLLGSEVLSRQSSGSLDLDLSSLQAGVYFAVVESGGARQVRKIVVGY